jgi:hypothetical protein
VAEVVEHLPSKREALSSNSSTTKRQNKKDRGKEEISRKVYYGILRINEFRSV